MFNRKSIYYWKCDRPHAFYALDDGRYNSTFSNREEIIRSLLHQYFGSMNFSFCPAGGQGNHITYLILFEGNKFFLRIEDGPEGDNYMGIEAKVIEEVSKTGVKTPRIFSVDSSREKVPFAFQIMEFIDFLDLNTIYKGKELDSMIIGEQIGQNIARWQSVKGMGFGLMDPQELVHESKLMGLHDNYIDYYLLNFERHLSFLLHSGFLDAKSTKELQHIVKIFLPQIRINQGCLVHKDLALWNILGTKDEIKAFIDWDDSIFGDPTDDISLLACFHNWEFIETVISGYQSILTLPENFEIRLWLHLLRNMIVKAVIRVGAGYFTRMNDFFLFDTGCDGKSLEKVTRERIQLACSGLMGKAKMTDL